MADDKMSPFEIHREALEELAISTLLELMGDGSVDPKVRKECADSALKAVGRDAPPKAPTGPAITFNFGTGLKSALGGLDTFQALLARPVDGTTEITE